MYEHLTDREVQDFIRIHEADDETALILKYKEIHQVPIRVIAQQIAGRKKAKTKLPLYYSTRDIIYPPGVNLEQSTAEAIALLKVDLIRNLSLQKNSCIDLTGGFGVDSFFLSRLFKTVVYVEPDEALFAIARHNHNQLKATNISHYNAAAETFLQSNQQSTDLIYIDPSRRTDSKRVFRFADCQPNVLLLLDSILGLSTSCLIKSSPMLDIQQGITELKWVQAVYVLADENECKEVLFLCNKTHEEAPVIHALNIVSGQYHSFSFYFSEEQASDVSFDEPGRYVYEPNAAIMKAGAFKLISHRYRLSKISTNTHLYTSHELIHDFPGRVFEVSSFVKPDPAVIRKFLPAMKANVMVRNYPLRADELKKKTGVKDGGEDFLIGFSGRTKKYLALARRVV